MRRGPHPRSRNRKPQAGSYPTGAGRPSPSPPKRRGQPVALCSPASARMPGLRAPIPGWQDRLPSLASRRSLESEKEAAGGTMPASWGAYRGRLPSPQSLPDFGVRAEMRDWRRKETRPWADAHAGKALAYSSRRRHLGPHFAGEQTKRGTDKVTGNERVNWSPDCKPGLVGTRIRALPPRPTARWRGESLGTPWAAELPLYLLGAKALPAPHVLSPPCGMSPACAFPPSSPTPHPPCQGSRLF